MCICKQISTPDVMYQMEVIIDDASVMISQIMIPVNLCVQVTQVAKVMPLLDDYSSPDYCHLATTSAWPVRCRGPGSQTNIGPINPNAECYVGNWNGGCFIKRGILLYLNIVSKSIKVRTIYIKIYFRSTCNNILQIRMWQKRTT